MPTTVALESLDQGATEVRCMLDSLTHQWFLADESGLMQLREGLGGENCIG
jgi:hypothetical protein